MNQKAKDQKAKDPSSDRKPKPGTDEDRDKTLTEKAEEKSEGTNRKTPGPIYDV